MEQIKLSDFKIIPIVSSAKRLKISDEEYFSKKYAKYISNSRLKYINTAESGSPELFKHPPKFQTQSLFLGSAIHELVLQPEVFTLGDKYDKPTAKLGATIDKIKFYRKNGYSIYDSIKNAAQDCDYYINQIDSKISKILKEGYRYYLKTRNLDESILLLSNKDWDICNACVNNVLNNNIIYETLNPTDDFFNPLPSFNEDAIFLDVLVTYKDKYAILKLKMKADN